MRSLIKLILAGALAIATASTAIAQNASENSQNRHIQQGQQFQHGRPSQTPGGELNYNEWKKSDDARTFDRSIYSGSVKY